MTQLEAARQGTITPELRRVAEREGVDPQGLAAAVARGEAVVLRNRNHQVEPVGIGWRLRTKVNANVGTSPEVADLQLEVRKARTALEAGADTLMDLSTGGDLNEVRRALLELPLPLGTVPVYQAGVEAARRRGSVARMDPEEIFEAIERQAAEGVDFMTVHCGITLRALELARGRLGGIVSRGGAFLACWMMVNRRENPLYEGFDRLLKIARRHDVVLSLGDALRPGCLEDGTDRAQLEELATLGELVERARGAGVQAMVEGPGHLRLDQVELNVRLAKRLCHGAPFYVLGPLVTDVAPGYDHLVAAIGGAVAGAAGADFLCYVTPGEHLRLPHPEDVREGVMAARIAAHAADLVKDVPGARRWDREMSRARATLDWERQRRLALDPERMRTMMEPGEGCSMCGEFCALKLVRERLR